MVTAEDEELRGVARRSDPMGFLAVWSTRARDLVPHLTEQTTDVRGFQILVEALRIWDIYERAHPEHAGRITDFFLLVEQAFAQTIGSERWTLPGSTRVRARQHEWPKRISVTDYSWHTLRDQKGNGIWGLYRGAARRADLIAEDMIRLSDPTYAEAQRHQCLGKSALRCFFDLAKQALAELAEPIALPCDGRNALVRDIRRSFGDVPLADHFREKLLDGHALNRALAEKLKGIEILDHRSFVVEALNDLPDHREALDNAVRCENLLAVVESVFFWLCAPKRRGQRLHTAAQDLPADPASIEDARGRFAASGHYGRGTAQTRCKALLNDLDTSDKEALAKSVIRLHESVSNARGRAAWVWEEDGRLQSDVDTGEPSDQEFHAGVAWRNDYYLRPLMLIAHQLSHTSQRIAG